MFIVEGPDGGGKTTLIRRLQDELGFELMPRACTSDNGVDPTTLKQWVEDDLRNASPQGLFYDRHPLISEPIYGPLIRGEMAEGFNHVGWLATQFARLSLMKPVMIFCLPPKQIVLENIRDSHEATTDHLEGVLRSAGAIYDLYCLRAAQEALSISTWVWDFTRERLHEDFKILLDLARQKL